MFAQTISFQGRIYRISFDLRSGLFAASTKRTRRSVQA